MKYVYGLLGYCLFIASGLLMWFITIKFFNIWWGGLGLYAGIFIVPIAVFFPLIYWVITGIFPLLYFLLWGIGLFGGFLIGISNDESKNMTTKIEVKKNNYFLKKLFQFIGALVVIVILIAVVIPIITSSVSILLPNKTKTEQTINTLSNNWWLSEYPDLINKVKASEKSTLRTSFVGQDGKSEFILSYENGVLVLTSYLPKKSIYSVDDKTGKETPSKEIPIMVIRDHNLDGKPDDFTVSSDLVASYGKNVEFTSDKFILIRDTEYYTAIKFQWSIGIAYAINHFLHNVDSVMPR